MTARIIVAPFLSLLLLLVLVPVHVSAQATLTLYLSPYCPLSTMRYREVFDPLRRNAEPTRFRVRFGFINSSGNERERAALRQLVCAERAGVMEPLFFYLGDLHLEHREPRLSEVLPRIALDSTAFHRCLQDPSVDARLADDRSRFDAAGLDGLPSFTLEQDGRTEAYTLTNYVTLAIFLRKRRLLGE